MENRSTGSLVTIPGAIIIAGAIIAIAIIWTQKPAQSPSSNNANSATNAVAQAALPQISMKPVTAADHILGNPNAPFKLVEYSDPSCPYCKIFNPTMEQIINQYGPGGQVAWVYRQYPLDKPDPSGNILHPLSGVQAEGMECAASLGGNTAFWAYEKDWFANFPENGANETISVNAAQMASSAKAAGLDPVAFNDCVASNRFKDKIEGQFTDGVNVQVPGTPYTIIVTPSGTKIPLQGAQSYGTLKNVLDTLINSNPAINGTTTTSQ